MQFILAVFLGAFLLFQIQPFIAKLILPYFGGGAAVWTGCLLFFQAFLLLGYLYAHLLTQYLSVKSQLIVHTVLLVVSLAALPIGLQTTMAIDGQPLASILLLLSLSIGLPYLVLSATGPILQRWQAMLSSEKIPYKLYSLSNFASLLALVSYPFMIEPMLLVSQQAWGWSLLYVVFVFALLWLMLSLKKGLPKEDIDSKQLNSVNVSARKWGLWLGLSALGVVMLVATTSAMTQNIPPVPFLWILPLSLYLLTFIICFHSERWYVRSYWLVFYGLAALLALLMYFIGTQFDIISQVIIYSSILFSACMVCHGELVRTKPDINGLTFFYLMLALGGFLGSALVALIATNIFDQYLEYPIAVIFIFVLVAWANMVKPSSIGSKQHGLTILLICAAGLLTLGFTTLNNEFVKTNIMSKRNFYGIISVKDVDVENEKERRLIDGTTSHGTQSLALDKRTTPLSYYRANTGVAIALELLAKQGAVKAGFIGLGAGTLAAYGNEGDTYTFYELNPAVINAANEYFSYIADSRATVSIISGDARVSIEQEWQQGINHQYDIIVVDAFSGDSIPQHLLTVEAINLYFKQLNNNGVLAVHISNTHLDLTNLMIGLAQATNKEWRYFKTRASNNHEHDTEWFWLTNNPSLLKSATVNAYANNRNLTSPIPIVWTDNYSNLVSILK